MLYVHVLLWSACFFVIGIVVEWEVGSGEWGWEAYVYVMGVAESEVMKECDGGQAVCKCVRGVSTSSRECGSRMWQEVSSGVGERG